MQDWWATSTTRQYSCVTATPSVAGWGENTGTPAAVRNSGTKVFRQSYSVLLRDHPCFWGRKTDSRENVRENCMVVPASPTPLPSSTPRKVEASVKGDSPRALLVLSVSAPSGRSVSKPFVPHLPASG